MFGEKTTQADSVVVLFSRRICQTLTSRIASYNLPLMNHYIALNVLSESRLENLVSHQIGQLRCRPWWRVASVLYDERNCSGDGLLSS